MFEVPSDSSQPDDSETVYISALALLKMLRHGREKAPFEVMGLMLGEFVDAYTINVVDVFPMPQQCFTNIYVEKLDKGYGEEILEMLKKTARLEIIVGWYHCHAGYSAYLSADDLEYQKEFEKIDKRYVAVVIDPFLSRPGAMEIGAFRSKEEVTATSADGRRHGDLDEEGNLTDRQRALKNVGREDPKQQMAEEAKGMITANVAQVFTTMMNSASLKK